MKSRPLIQVIQSLSKPEKRKFRMNYPQTDPPEYIRLYDWIVKAQEPDDKGIQLFLRKKGSALGNVRRRLWEVIEDFLTKESSSESKTAYNSIILAGELISRQCYEAGVAVIEEGKAVCTANENLNCHLELLKCELGLPWNYQSEDVEDQMRVVGEKFLEVTELAQIERDIPRGFQAQQSRELQISYFMALLGRDEYANPEERLSKNAEYQNHLILRKAYLATENYPPALIHSDAILVLLSESGSKILKAAEKCLDELSIKLFLCEELGLQDEYSLTLCQLAHFETETPQLKAKKVNLYFLPLIVTAIDTGDSDNGDKLIHEYLPVLESVKDLVAPKDLMRLYFYLVKYHWQRGNLRKVNYWIGQLQEIKSSHIKLFSFFNSYLLAIEVMLYLDKGEINLVDSRMGTLKNHLSKNGVGLEFFRIFQRMVSLISKKTEQQVKKTLPSLNQELKNLKSKPQESFSFAFVDITLWAESKLNGKSVLILTREKEANSGKKAGQKAS